MSDPKYRIISGATAKELAQNVNAAMADGYTPTGGVQYAVSMEYALWVQSVVARAPGMDQRGTRVNPDGIAIAAPTCKQCDEIHTDPARRCPACPRVK
jgi:hypothetical protein